MVAFRGKLLLRMYGSHSGASRLSAVWRLSAFWRVRYRRFHCSLLLHVATCINKSMQIILERDSIDKPLTFNVCLLQLIFHTSVFTYYIYMKGVFNPNI